MSADHEDDDEKGLLGARTRAALGDSVADLAAQLAAPADDQLDLLQGSPDLDDLDVLSEAANQVAGRRRARGRPAGSANRRNSAVFDYLDALGHRHPAVTLSLIQTADTMALARALGTPMMADGKPVLQPVFVDGEPLRDAHGALVMVPLIVPADPLKVLAVQEKAAANLLPFDLAKKKELEVRKSSLHMFIAGDLGAAPAAGKAAGLSIFGGGQIVENQSLSGGDAVRIDGEVSHEAENSSNINDIDG